MSWCHRQETSVWYRRVEYWLEMHTSGVILTHDEAVSDRRLEQKLNCDSNFAGWLLKI